MHANEVADESSGRVYRSRSAKMYVAGRGYDRVDESRDHFHAGFSGNCRICRRALKDYSITLIPDYWFNLLLAAAAAGGGCQATNTRAWNIDVSYSRHTLVLYTH